ncbi:Ig-like domain repeat protein [Nocardioides sambongensis]|uniref:Ig-like domain repeat protein n=1 Tax=Nocardioides sambongensis TaxID=2589074 RepID=UPI0011278586|nr:Ig-like domain repeat protein [Nocardioides sambongensis]
MRPRPSSRRRPVRLVAPALGLAVGLGLAAPALPAQAAPSEPAEPAEPAGGSRLDAAAEVDADTPPTLTPKDGAFLTGTVTVASTPTVPEDDVVELAVDDASVDATETAGFAELSFDVGSNSASADFGNHVIVNGEHRIDIPTVVSERATLQIPAEELVSGDNVIEVVVGTTEGSCGTNYDDFALSDFRLDLLEETADGEENEYTYAFGDGSCGTNTSLLTSAELHFNVAGTPGATTGLTTELDTTSLANGRHTITATTAEGVEVSHQVRVNNAPAGAPVITPSDGTVLTGMQPLIAAAEGGVSSLLVDGAEPEVPVRLASGTATLDFTVGSNSIDARYENHLLVNGNRVEIGGDHVSEDVSLSFPNRYLVPGTNRIEIVTGTINGERGGERCANHDDFALSGITLKAADGTATPVDVAASYPMGDGTCGSSSTAVTEATLEFTVDGATTSRTLQTLAPGTARLDYTMGGNGADAGFPNTIAINGNVTEFGPQEPGRATLSFPNEWLVPGVNVIDVVAGAVNSGDCDNYDDFPLTELDLVPASGTDVKLTKMEDAAGVEHPVAIGDGVCGSSFASAHRRTQLFRVDAPAGGLRVDVDTTTLTDGEHEVSATSSGGQSASRTISVDNTGPAVASSVPAAGQWLNATVALEVELDDLTGVAGDAEITLDGEPVALGDPIGAGLDPGRHVIRVIATDAVGNTATRRIPFQNAGIPAAPTELSPADGSTDQGASVDLSARVTTPGGNGVTATFHEAEVVAPEAGFAGTADTLPTTLEVTGEESVDVDSLAPISDGTVEAPASTEITFQRYDVPVGAAAEAGTDADPVVRWQGVIDPERTVALRVWDAAAGEWVVQTSARGTVEGDTVLTASVPARLVDAGTLHVMVTGEDPFADDLQQPDPVANELDDPASYDFSLAHYTDTQYLSEGAAGGTYDDFDGVTEDTDVMTEVEQAIWQRSYRDTTEWLAANADDRKIAYVAHTGDIIENNINNPDTVGNVNPDTGLNELDEQVRKEFEASSEYQKVLDDAGVVSQVVAGNHDNQRGTETGPTSRFNTYFGPGRYDAADDTWGEGNSYGGPWKEGDNQNNYVLFSAGGLDFVGIGLSYGVDREEARWADGILKRYADRNAIVLTHDYLAPSTSPDGRGGGLMGDGSALYKLLVEPNPNVFLVLAGHRHGVAANVKRGVGVTMSNGVVELLADYQAYTATAEELGLDGDLDGDGDVDHAPTDRLRFGASFLRLLQFDVERSVMSVDTYSPHLDDLGATEYDIAGEQQPRYDGTEDAMVLPVDLNSRTTSFTTDSVAAFLPGERIGSDTVASGEVATVTWDDLGVDSTHGWMVTARSSGGGRAVSEPAVFATAGAAAPTLTVDPVTAAHGEDVAIEVEVDAGDVVATGDVTISDGDDELATATLEDGTATLTVPAGLDAGTHDLTVAYAGDDRVAAAEVSVQVTITADDAPVATTDPSISGTPEVGETLSADPGAWDLDDVELAYQWLRDGTAIDGATGATYQVTAADIRTSLRVRVTATAPGHSPGSARSASVLVGKVASTTSATAPGRVKKGQRALVSVSVGASGVTPNGTVRILDGSRVVGTGRLVDGEVKIRIRRMAPGRHRLVVTYAGSAQVQGSTDAVVVRVSRR